MDVHQSLEAASNKSSSKFHSQSIDFSFSKENLSPSPHKSQFLRNPTCSSVTEIDSEIESIEKEISRLSSRLEYLRLEKAKQIAAKSAAALKRGRFVPAKFMNPSPAKGNQNPRKIDESVITKKTMLGRRGISLGPAEIYSAAKSRRSANQKETTPIYRSQIMRKSSFWKLREGDELQAIKEQAVTTLRASKNKSVKNEDEFISSVQPKKLFGDGDKSVTAKKPLQVRAVASRYKCSNGNSATPNGARKRSLPDDMESKTFDRKRISLSRKFGE